MNGSKAKQLRKMVGDTSEPTKYTHDKRTIRKKFMNVDAGMDGHGEPMFNRIEWMTGTIIIAGGSRKLLKIMKNIYKSRTRGYTIHTQEIVTA